MASAEAQRMADEQRAAYKAFVEQYGSADLGPEIAAISQRAIQHYKQVADSSTAMTNTARVKSGKLSIADWTGEPYNVYDPHFDYEQRHHTTVMHHCGMREALLVALAVRFPEPDFNALERDWLADHLSGRPSPAKEI